MKGEQVTHSINYGKWNSLRGYGAFAAKRETPLLVQFSGGRTSGFMAAMAPDETTITFQNTGSEHEKTLEFVRNVGDAMDREITWLEFRPPPRIGDPPRMFGFEIVNFKTASRKGEPFVEFMRAINAYRAACGNGLISPWPRSRICTTHLKHRVLDHYLKSIGIDAHDRWIGMRADEPHRAAALRRQETLTKGLNSPLAEAGVIKDDVMEFWSRQSFDLGLAEYNGNCKHCFLKDQSDVSRAMGEDPEGVELWDDMRRQYPNFGGVGFYGYRALANELPTRLAIEAAYAAGAAPVDDGRLGAKRFRLVMIQERKRFEHGPAGFSCACESGQDAEDDDDDPEIRRAPERMPLLPYVAQADDDGPDMTADEQDALSEREYNEQADERRQRVGAYEITLGRDKRVGGTIDARDPIAALDELSRRLGYIDWMALCTAREKHVADWTTDAAAFERGEFYALIESVQHD